MTIDRQPLVADDQPQGQRQQTVATMRAAGIPLAPTPPSRAPVGGAGTPLAPTSQGVAAGASDPGLRLLEDAAPGDFAFLTDPARQDPGTPPVSEPDSVAAALAAASQSSFGQAVLARLQSRGP